LTSPDFESEQTLKARPERDPRVKKGRTPTAVSSNFAMVYPSPCDHLETLMAKELKKKRDEAKQAWENATVVMKKSKNADDFTGSKKAHDEAERLRVQYLQ
jgi:hypothetical protein